MMRIKIDLKLDQNVSTHLSFILLLVLSFLVAWFSISKAQEIIRNSKESSAFNIEKRVQKEIPSLENDNLK